MLENYVLSEAGKFIAQSQISVSLFFNDASSIKRWFWMSIK